MSRGLGDVYKRQQEEILQKFLRLKNIVFSQLADSIRENKKYEFL